jgi:hypothetical protein
MQKTSMKQVASNGNVGCLFNGLHSVISQKMELVTATSVGTTNLMTIYEYPPCNKW